MALVMADWKDNAMVEKLVAQMDYLWAVKLADGTADELVVR